MGDGRAEGTSAIGGERQAAVSLMPDVDITGSGSLLDSILSTLLKKQSSDVWIVLIALFFLFISVPATTPLLLCLLPDILGLKLKYYPTVLYIVLYRKEHKSATTCRGCLHMTVYAKHLNLLT